MDGMIKKRSDIASGSFGLLTSEQCLRIYGIGVKARENRDKFIGVMSPDPGMAEDCNGSVY